MENEAEDQVFHLPKHTDEGLPRIIPLGDSAVSVIFEAAISPQTHRRVKAVCSRLISAPFTGMIEFVPSFHSVAVYYDGPAVLRAYPHFIAQGEEYYPFPIVAALLEEMLKLADEQADPAPRIVSIPVCYGGETGPDLEFVARYNRLSVEEVIDIHSSADYLVYMLGFAPGFPYLGGLSPAISTPRRPSPRLAIPAGSVGIAGDQTGVYPLETPGGWQLIGRTPVALFRPHAVPPVRLQAGDLVRFYPVSFSEFSAWKDDRL
ncbi:5-oxoprolinase subunit PxpB [Paenibacillus sp. DMB5]|uniref:5-oxoprolinase subunit PxpB n=1 Tax=Paenibacillus sp. DMB5 TaxID=1780103 RepID=UPI000A976809|nr:5-oxoprolinase subunit PxpB [Paenibacillus sp. DMB5]